MKLLQVNDQAWTDLKHSLATGNAPNGIFMVTGPSDELADEAQAVLTTTSQNDYHVRYFICNNGDTFHVPCFFPVIDDPTPAEPLNVTHFFAERQKGGGAAILGSIARSKVEKLEQTVLREVRASHTPQIILLEYFAAPAKLDLSFTLLLLKSLLPQHVSLVMLYHQQDSSRLQQPLPFINESAEESLSMLYLCGGRVRLADWQKLGGQFPAPNDSLIASRSTGTDTWICYANRQAADRAATTLQTMNQARRQEIARQMLHILPHCAGYPLLAIASETANLDAMLSVYSQSAIEIALAEPKGLVRYFDRLQQEAQSLHDTTTAGTGYILYLFSHTLLQDKIQVVHIYKKLRGMLPGTIDAKIRSAFWNWLGQSLVNQEHPEAWEYAAECFRLSHECLQSTEQINPVVLRHLQAALANGEALIAYKLQEGHKAQQLVEHALSQLHGIVTLQMLAFQIHITTNLGDVYLRSLDDLEGAATRYGDALLASIRIPQQLKEQATLEVMLPWKQRAALRLGSTLIQMQRYEEAILILEQLLSDLEKVDRFIWAKERYAPIALKTRMTLALAYLKVGQKRSAAVCYWTNLRHPRRLDPATLKDVATMLRACRPDSREYLRTRVERVISEQEAIAADALAVQEIFADIYYSPQHSMAV